MLHVTNFWCITILIGVIGLRNCNATKPNSLHTVFTGVKCVTIDKSLLKYFRCALTPDNRGLPLWNLRFSVNNRIEHIGFHYKLYIERNDKYNVIVNLNIDYCREWLKLDKNMFLRFTVKEVLRVSNLLCPFKKDTMYYIRDFNTTKFMVPNYMPEVKFMSFVEISVQRKLISTIQIFGKVMHLTNSTIQEMLATLKSENIS